MVRRILEAGRFAPSAGNYQPWKFIVLRDPEVINGITETVISSCRTFRAMIDYRRKGYAWLKPLMKFFTRFRHNDLHPMPFSAIPHGRRWKAGALARGADGHHHPERRPRGVQPGPRLRDSGAEHGARRPQHGPGDLLGGFFKTCPGKEPDMEKTTRASRIRTSS